MPDNQESIVVFQEMRGVGSNYAGARGGYSPIEGVNMSDHLDVG